MFKTCIFNLILPVLGFFMLNSLKATQGSIEDGYMTWFYAAGAFQLGAAVVLLKGNAKLWGLGWALLWCSSACFMGGYSDLHIQDRVHLDVIGGDSRLTNLQAKLPLLNTELAALPGDSSPEDRTALENKVTALIVKIEEADLGKMDEASKSRSGGLAGSRKTYAERYGREVPAEFRETFIAVRDHLTLLEYVMSLLFLGAFFSVAAFSSLPAQKAYQIKGASTEDPLNLANMLLDKSS